MDRKLDSFGRLLDVMDRLRSECPWDREQTFDSLRSNTIEETFELTDAIAEGDMEHIKEELGDVLLHIVFYAKMASEQGAFDMGDVIDALCDKLIYRHPHVFGDTQVEGAKEVIRNWERLKLAQKSKQERKEGILGGVPRSLPAMVKALRIGEKAAGAGFDWERREDVWDKVSEELSEVKETLQNDDLAHRQEEFGDLFFALINAARLYDIDPETALERTNKKFIRRFRHIESRAREQGKQLSDMPLAEMEEYWQEAKING